MPLVLSKDAFRDKETYTKYVCPHCNHLLHMAVQAAACGHWMCESCIKSLLESADPVCPKCRESIKSIGTEYFPDKFVRRDIAALAIDCPHSKTGCVWVGHISDLKDHLCSCTYSVCCDCQQHLHTVPSAHSCSIRDPLGNYVCPLARVGCVTSTLPTKISLESHMRESGLKHNVLLVQFVASLQTKCRSSDACVSTGDKTAELKIRDETISSLTQSLENKHKQCKALELHLAEMRLRVNQLELGTHDGKMLWKIPQFGQRMKDAMSGKYTSIFSLPFFTARYGYRMCLRLYIMGDGIGKGTHSSLFLVVMQGEFDNILLWPFSCKSTFHLVNQVTGKDLVDTFESDFQSSSFRKPKTAMNVAAGIPRFVAHKTLQNGQYIMDDTVFIRCKVTCFDE